MPEKVIMSGDAIRRAIVRMAHEAVESVDGCDELVLRDDLPYLEVQPVIRPNDIPTSITDKDIVLVDDVLFTGRSTRAAMDAIIDFGRPKRILLAVLIDRGHRELPIKANFVGKNIPSSKYERIQLRLRETDGVDEVVIVSPAKAAVL